MNFRFLVALGLIGIAAGTGMFILITRGGTTNNPCGEGIHVTHNGLPIANIAVKQLGTYTWGSTNSTGYFILSFCQPVGTIITFQATDYGFQLEPHQIVEAVL